MANVLMLSNSYAPLGTISWQRAITLLFTDKVEIIESYDGFIRSSTLVIKMPAVVRLLRVFRKFRSDTKFSRINVYSRDRWQCQYCGNKFGSDDLTFDHVVPKTQGGRTEWTNIVSACNFCNNKKGGRTPEQARMKLLKHPVMPKWIPSVQIQLSNKNTPSQWSDYLYWNSTIS